MTMPLSAKQTEYIAAAPVLSRSLVQRALECNAAPRQAIKAKCLTCCNYDRHEVEHCTVQTCPLWAYRPYTAKSNKPPTTDDAVGAPVERS